MGPNFLITVWMSLNCIGKQIGTAVVQPNRCLEPPFGLAFQANESYVTVATSCVEPAHTNTARCDVVPGGTCCQVPGSLSVNISETSLGPTQSGGQARVGLPEPTQGRRFVCIEQF